MEQTDRSCSMEGILVPRVSSSAISTTIHGSSFDSRIIAGLTKQAARAKLDQELEKALQYLYAIRAIRNSISPVYHLPDEVLAEIFRIIWKSRNQFKGVDTWLAPTQVCRWWRSVALRSAVLWTFIDSTNLERVSTYMKRSATARVTVRIPRFYVTRRYDAQFLRDLVDILRPHVARISSLHLQFESGTIEEFLGQRDLPLDTLEDLALTSLNSHCARDLSSLSLGATRDHPNTILQELSLNNIDFPWGQLHFRGLRTLHLLSTRSRPTMKEFLRLLESCPQLQCVSSIESGPRASMTDLQPVEMRHLQDFVLQDSAADISSVLSYLIIPARCHLKLSSTTADTIHGGLVELLPRDRSKLKNLPPTGPFDMKVKLVDFSIKCSVTTRETSVLSFELSCGDEDDPSERFLEVFMSLPVVFHGGYLVSLHVEAELEDIQTSDWHTVLSAFPSITTLTVLDLSQSVDREDYGQPIFFMALERTQAGSQGSVLCPNLQELRIISFSVNKAFADSLRSCLDTRAKKGAPLPSKICLTEPIFENDPDFQWPDLSDFVTEFIYPDLLELANGRNMDDELE